VVDDEDDDDEDDLLRLFVVSISFKLINEYDRSSSMTSDMGIASVLVTRTMGVMIGWLLLLCTTTKEVTNEREFRR